MNLADIGRRMRGTGLMALGAGLYMAGLALPALAATAAPVQVQTVNFTLSEFRIEPASVTVRAGEQVNFTARNVGQFPHDVHIEGGGVVFEIVEGTGNIAAGQSASASFTFTQARTYEMWCPVGRHREQGMVGVFTVLPAGAQVPGAAQLPRTGDGDMTLLAMLAVLAGAASVYAGYRVRRAAE